METRFQLVFIAALLALSSAYSQTVTWTGATDSEFNNSTNWSGGLPGSTSDAVFTSSGRTRVNVSGFTMLGSLTFAGTFPSYTFTGSSNTLISLSFGGVNVGTAAGSQVFFDDNVGFELMSEQTWTTGSDLVVRGPIDGSAGSLVKAGERSLLLGGANTYGGGTDLQEGTLILEGRTEWDESGAVQSGPIGTGTLTLGDGTTLSLGKSSVELGNAIALGNNVTIDGGKWDDAHLGLFGDVTLAQSATRLHVKGDSFVLLAGALDGPAGSSFTVDSGNALVLRGAVKAGVTSMVADRGILIFASPDSLPSTVQVNATNGGYLGIASPATLTTPLTVASLLARIATPAGFQGTFGFDSEEDETRPTYVFSEDLDFSTFTDPLFRIGSASSAVLTGKITPPTAGGTPLYAFGGGPGHLGIASALTDVAGVPSAVLVTSPTGSVPQSVIFRGNNSFSGTTTLGTVTANLLVSGAIAVLDSPTALPAAAKFGFAAGTPGYVGATDATAFGSFSDFVAHLVPGGYNERSILGIDSHAYYESVITTGNEHVMPTKIGGTIDLRSLGPIHLGTVTDVILYGTVFAPSDGVLRLTALEEGRLTLSAPFGDNVISVVIGLSGDGDARFSSGTVKISGNNTYAGGTTLVAGALEVYSGPDFFGTTATPLGTGPLTIAADGISTPIVQGRSDGSSVINVPVVLNRALQVNDWRTSDGNAEQDTPEVLFMKPISGAGSLDIFGGVWLDGSNTYSGGTILNSGAAVRTQSSSEIFGTGPVEVRGDVSTYFHGYDAVTVPNALRMNGMISFGQVAPVRWTGPVTIEGTSGFGMFWSNDSPTQLEGNISGSGSLLLTTRWGLSASYELSGTNTYTGGTNAAGASVVFRNEQSVPAVGRLTMKLHEYGGGSYLGAAFTTNTASGFIDRFDKASVGVIGFDSADPQAPNVFTADIDLTGFTSSIRLGSSSVATLAGTITPTDATYRFGGSTGTLTISGPLTGVRSVDVDRSYTRDPMTLVLKGTNTYSGGTTVRSSIVRFESAGAMPANGSLSADHGYIGITEAVGLSAEAFLARFSSATEGVIGFDSADLLAPRTLTSPAMPGRYASYLGTSTTLIVEGTLSSPETRLAAVGNGALTVNAIIPSGTLNVGAGSFLSRNASVTLNGANTFAGGTFLNSTRLILGHATALGTGTLTVGPDDSSLGTNVSGLSIANPISAPSSLRLEGPNNFSLTGQVTGANLTKTGTSVVTLGAHNAGLGGYFNVYTGGLILSQDDSLGTSTLYLSPNTFAEFQSAAPSVSGLSSDSGDGSPGIVRLANNSTLTIGSYGSFSGQIEGSAGIRIVPGLNSGTALTLSGTNTFTGGTTVTSGATVIAGSSGAFGTTGNVTLNGTLRVGGGASLSFAAGSHALVFESGRLGGAGSLSFNEALRIGASRTLAPGDVHVEGAIVSAGAQGNLSLSFSDPGMLVFESGGAYEWRIADANQMPGTGWSQVTVTGTLDIASTAAAPFSFTIVSGDFYGNASLAMGFDPSRAYSWTVLTASAITGFDAAKFAVDASGFLNVPVDAGFTLSLSSTDSASSLLLNYNPAAVPEPGTWALLLGGLAAMALLSRRRSA